MCTFRSEREVVICDIAICQVRARLGDFARYTPIGGQGTLVQAGTDLDGRQFQQLVEAGIAAACSTAEAPR